jgi:radical SAM protein with 4Fe4S-binding SPASM domain
MGGHPVRALRLGRLAVIESADRRRVFDLLGQADVALSGNWGASGPFSAAAARALLRALGGDGDTQSGFSELLVSDVLAPRGWGLLFLELTGRCNERCIHCYADASPEVEDELSLIEVEGILEEAQSLGFRRVQLTGGDPLISPVFLQAAQRVRDLGLGLEVFTNGLALRPPLAEELKRLGATLAFSFYSADPAEHDLVTQVPGSQERTLRAILLAHSASIPVRVGLIGTRNNPEGPDKAIRFLVQRGLPMESLSVSWETQVGRGQAISGTASEIPMGGPLHGDSDAGGKLCVSYRGDVFPCIFDRRNSMGNIHQARLSDWLARPALSLPSLASLALPGEPLKCADCEFRRQVFGGLRRRAT